MTYLLFFLLLPVADLAIFVWLCLVFALGWLLRGKWRRGGRLTPCALLLTISLLPGCTAAENFFAHDRKLYVDGLYTVTQYGMLGVGRVQYDSTTPASDARLKELEARLEELRAAIAVLVMKLYEK